MEVNGEGPDVLAGMVISGLLCVWGGGGVWAIPDPRWLKAGLTNSHFSTSKADVPKGPRGGEVCFQGDCR